MSWSTLFAERGEGRGIVGVDGHSTTTSTTGTGLGSSTGSSAGATTGTSASTSARASTALTTVGTTTGTSATTTRALGGCVGLLPAAVVVDGELLLALTLTLLLAGTAGNEVLVVVLDKRLGAGPLLVVSDGLADALGVAQGELLLGLLGEVGLKSDLLDLGLFVLSFGILSLGILLLGLGNGLSSLLVLELSLAFGGTPRLGSLLLGAAVKNVSIYACDLDETRRTYGATFLVWRSSALRWWVAPRPIDTVLA